MANLHFSSVTSAAEFGEIAFSKCTLWDSSKYLNMKVVVWSEGKNLQGGHLYNSTTGSTFLPTPKRVSVAYLSLQSSDNEVTESPGCIFEWKVFFKRDQIVSISKFNLNSRWDKTSFIPSFLSNMCTKLTPLLKIQTNDCFIFLGKRFMENFRF